MKPGDVLDFWFSGRVSELWFNSTPEFDREVRSRFEETFRRALAGEFDAWAGSPEGALALVIVLDQFPLNMYRGEGRAYSSGDAAVRAARAALAQGFDRALPREQLPFLLLPFMHSEAIEDQNFSVSLYERAGLKENLRFARHHHDIVKRFGRFPHRNEALGRESTAEEKAYLASKEGYRG